MTDDLSTLLHDAVAGVDPADRLAQIRARTATPARTSRPWLLVAAGAAVATAAAVATFAVTVGDRTSDEGVATNRPVAGQVVPAYFIGDTARGPRLFREFDQVAAGDPLQAALQRIQMPPDDPDYATGWPADALASAEVRDGIIEVEDGTVDADITELASQQLVYTLQGVVGERLPVQLLHDGDPAGPLLTADPGALNRVLVSDPVEGREVDGYFTARGATASGGNVRWELRAEDRTVVRRGVTSSGRSWQARVDVEDLPPGTYTFVGSVGPDSDTRTIVVR